MHLKEPAQCNSLTVRIVQLLKSYNITKSLILICFSNVKNILIRTALVSFFLKEELKVFSFITQLAHCD